MAESLPFGATTEGKRTSFRVRAPAAATVHLCLFDGETETARLAMTRNGDDFVLTIDSLPDGATYGYRADGRYAPDEGFWFDPAKLLIDPYATRIDRAWRYDPRLAAHRDEAIDTAPLVAKSMIEILADAPRRPVHFKPGELIYEINVRAFTMRHPGVVPDKRGTLAALGEPAILDHLKAIGATAVELMPITAWIDERHLPPLGLANAWGYNPVTFMALDPRLAPNGTADLAELTAKLGEHGISVILDLVFNHTGESDAKGPTLALRGLDNHTAYRHDAEHRLINDTGCGNTIDCSKPAIRTMVLASLRHFVLKGGVDGFRFDLAPVLGRTTDGFDSDAETLKAIISDPVLSDRILIAEPWDIGPGGYQLGRFPKPFLEWNDQARDRIRRFWRGDDGALADFATALAGSSDRFSGHETRSVNFIAAHDGFTLADCVSYVNKHNHANGEENRDGHNENLSWNNGVEGVADDPSVTERRRRDIMALLTTLFLSRGTIMLSAGDAFGRSQQGNNNAYAQDNAITWIDWESQDHDLLAHAKALSRLRRRLPALQATSFLTGAPKGAPKGAQEKPDIVWLTASGCIMTQADWHTPGTAPLMLCLATDEAAAPRLLACINRGQESVPFCAPRPDAGLHWWTVLDGLKLPDHAGGTFVAPPRSITLFLEQTAKTARKDLT
ncbi:MAG: glycogen debranching protein GlgX [Rhizobiales bacterium]|nr:glycogen debranching protein GlgX [Hyphomicrobiales bacterium]